MINSMKFSARIKNLRTTHNLSYQIVGDVLGLSKTAYRAWETGNIFPSLDILDNICKLFAVSSDWLLGHTDIIYNEDFILNLERELLTSTIAVGNSKISSFNINGFSELYYNESTRISHYSLAIRANIIYCLNLERAFLEYSYAYLHKSEVIHLQPYFPNLEDKTTFSKREKIKDNCFSFAQQMWDKKITEPVFKIPEDI